MSPDFSKLKRYSLFSRRSKVTSDLLGKRYVKGSSFREFAETLPPILASRDLLFLVERVRSARERGRKVVAGMGAHPLKVGLSPLINQLIEEGVINHLAVTGAFLVHDLELAMAGFTSEDVPSQLADGSFGMAEETSHYLNDAIIRGVAQGKGLAHSVATMLSDPPFELKGPSVLAKCIERGVVISAHVAIGTDIFHMHPETDGASLGEGSLRDFRSLTGSIKGLEGGVYLNVGSAVILPEVFLKAVAVARNLGSPLEDIVTAAFDFNRHYRVMENVVKRPVQKGGKGVYIVGHHEIIIPLFAGLILEGLREGQ